MKSIDCVWCDKTMLRLLSRTILATANLLLCQQLSGADINEVFQAESAKQPSVIMVEAVGKERLTTDLKRLPTSAFKTIDWLDLMPADDLEALYNPPSYITDIEEGIFEDQASDFMQNDIMIGDDDRYQQALSSTRIVSEMDGKAIRIPGFIVPMQFDDEQNITQFFLVPFFGACIHVPPPPPNQIIFVNYPKGLKVDELYDPIWVSGILETSLVQSELATAAYSIQMQWFEVYSD